MNTSVRKLTTVPKPLNTCVMPHRRSNFVLLALVCSFSITQQLSAGLKQLEILGSRIGELTKTETFNLKHEVVAALVLNPSLYFSRVEHWTWSTHKGVRIATGVTCYDINGEFIDPRRAIRILNRYHWHNKRMHRIASKLATR